MSKPTDPSTYPEVKGHTPGNWKPEKRNAEGNGYPIIGNVSAGDFPWLVNVPAPPFAMGAIGALVCYQQAEPNARLLALAPTAPHCCSDPACPGDVNRRKLEAAEKLAEAAARSQCACLLKERASGHLIDCWAVAVDEALAAWEAARG